MCDRLRLFLIDKTKKTKTISKLGTKVDYHERMDFRDVMIRRRVMNTAV